MNQIQRVKLSVTERSAAGFEHVVDMATICSNVVVKVSKDGHDYRAAALCEYHADQVTGKIDFEFDRLALEVLAVDSLDANACLTAIAQAPFAKLQVHEGSYGEAVFLLTKPKPKF